MPRRLSTRWLRRALPCTLLLLLPHAAKADTFGSPFRTYSIERSAVAVDLADWNGDGAMDVSVACDSVGRISTLVGNGTGSYVSQTDFNTGLAPTRIAAGDLSGDGVLDMITLNFTLNQIRVHRGVRASVGHDAIFTTSAGNGPADLAVGDVNHDGHQDVALAVQNVGQGRVMKGNGDGSLSVMTMFSIGSGANSVALSDLNGDEHLDVLVGYSSGVGIRFGDGTGVFGSLSTLSAPDVRDIAVGLLDGDEYPDLVAVTASGTIFTWINTGSGTFNPPGPAVAPIPFLRRVVIGDFGGSPSNDIAVLGEGALGAVLLGTDGSFTDPAILFRCGPFAKDLDAGDVNGDEILDLAIASSPRNVSILLGNGDGTFGVNDEVPLGAIQPTNVAIAEMNNDTFPDFVASAMDSIYVALGDGVGGSTASAAYRAPFMNPRALVVADLDDDGDRDVASGGTGVGGSGGAVRVLRNNGSGVLGPPIATSLVDAVANLAAGDMNGDELADLVVAQPAAGSVRVLINTGTSFTVVGSGPSGYAVDVAVGDLNGDTFFDVCAADSVGGTVFILFGDGGGGLVLGGIQPTAAGPTSVLIADVDADTWPDIIASCSTGDAVSVIHSQGFGSFGPVETISVPGSPRDLTVTTTGVPSTSRVYVTTHQDHIVQVLRSVAGGPFALEPPAWGTGAGPYGIAQGLVDGDGNPDLVVANVLDGSLQVLLRQPVAPPVDRAPIVSAPPTVNVELGGLLTFGVGAFDLDGDPISSLVMSSLPGASFVPAPGNVGGTVTWTPTSAQVGDHVVTFTATNALGVGTAQTAIHVLSNESDAAAVFLWNPTSSEVGTYTVCFQASGNPGELPDTVCTQVTVTSGGGGGTPAVMAALAPSTTTRGPVISIKGVNQTTVGTTLSLSVTASETDTLSVDTSDLPAGNTATFQNDQSPIVLAPQNVDGEPGVPIQIDVTAIDPDADSIDSIVADLSALPPGNNAVFTPNGNDNTSGTLTWTPTSAQRGVFGVTFRAENVLVGSAPTLIRVGSDLSGYWRLNQDGADMTGGTPLSVNGTASYGPGQLHEALTVSGSVTDGLQATGFADGTLPSGTGWALECWFRVTAPGAGEKALVVARGSDRWGFYVNASGLLHFQAVRNGGNGGATTDLVAPISVSDGAWHHAAVTSDGITASLYKDGVFQVADGWGTAANATGGVFSLGFDSGDPSAELHGAIDEVRLWGRQRTTAEIQEWMNQQLGGYATPVESSAPPLRNALSQNRPNPFNPGTSIRFETAQSGHVGLRVYDVAGRLVRTLVARSLSAGQHRAVWSGEDDSGRSVASGVYYYRLETDVFEETKRMLLIR